MLNSEKGRKGGFEKEKSENVATNLWTGTNFKRANFQIVCMQIPKCWIYAQSWKQCSQGLIKTNSINRALIHELNCTEGVLINLISGHGNQVGKSLLKMNNFALPFNTKKCCVILRQGSTPFSPRWNFCTVWKLKLFPPSHSKVTQWVYLLPCKESSSRKFFYFQRRWVVRTPGIKRPEKKVDNFESIS